MSVHQALTWLIQTLSAQSVKTVLTYSTRQRLVAYLNIIQYYRMLQLIKTHVLSLTR